MSDVERQIHHSIEVKLALIAQGGAEIIQRMGDIIADAIEAGNRFYVFGNGGSAADAQHIAGEFVGRFMKERRGLPGMALTTDTSVLTAVANDYSFADCFRRQVEALVREGDVTLAISTSGNAPNVIAACQEAQRIGARTLGMSGKGGGKLVEVTNPCLVVPADTSARIQESHITAAHIICDIVEKRLFD